MSLTNAALSIGAKVIGHDDSTIRVGKELYDGIRATNERGTIVVPPSIHGDGRTGPILNDIHGNIAGDSQQEEAREQQEPALQEAPAKRRRGKKAEAERPARVEVTASMDGFGTIRTAYAAFDRGLGCLRIELCDMSWTPPAAMVDESGNLSGLFSFDTVKGARFANVGLEFVHGGRRSIVLVEVPDA